MGNDCSLLLVEDDLAVSEALTKVLISENYRVLNAASRRQALSACAANQIEAVLLDLNLGDEDGWQVFHALKDLRPELPIIVTSAWPDQLVHASAGRASGVLEKPFEVPLLISLLKRATRPKGAQTELKDSAAATR